MFCFWTHWISLIDKARTYWIIPVIDHFTRTKIQTKKLNNLQLKFFCTQVYNSRKVQRSISLFLYDISLIYAGICLFFLIILVQVHVLWDTTKLDMNLLLQHLLLEVVFQLRVILHLSHLPWHYSVSSFIITIAVI